MNRFEPMLNTGEQILWTGQPKQGVVFRWADAVVILFSALWMVIPLLLLDEALARNAPLPLQLWSMLFVVVGLYNVLGRFWMDALSRSKTFYAITNKRALIENGLVNRSVRALPLDSLTAANLDLKQDGRGTITLVVPYSLYRPSFSRSGDGISNVLPIFEQIENAQYVYDLIQRHK